jgi:hypothetical protein
LELSRSRLGVQRDGSEHRWLGLELVCRRGSCFGLMPPPSSGGFRGVEGPVSHHAKQPGNGVFGESALRRELDERLLNDVLGRVAPLPRKQLERRRVSIDESSEQVGIHTKVAFVSAPLPLSCRS